MDYKKENSFTLVEIIRHGMAFLHGWMTRCLLTKKKTRIGKAVRMYRNAAVRCSNGGRIIIGEKARIDTDAVLTVRNHGNLELGDNVGVGPGNMIVCHEHISIGKNTIMGPNVLIYDHDHAFSADNIEKRKYVTEPVHIGENCWIGAGTIVLRGTTIGNNCIVGAGAVIKGTYPDGSIIVQKRETTVRRR